MYRIEKIWQTKAGLTAVVAVMQGEKDDLVYDKHRCGYVAVPKTHKAWGANYSDVGAGAHGGLTYSSDQSDKAEYPIKHQNSWWFGFDCAHYGDRSIEDPYDFGMEWGGVIRSREFVELECEKLASDLMKPDLKIHKYLWYTEGRWDVLKNKLYNKTVTLRWWWRYGRSKLAGWLFSK